MDALPLRRIRAIATALVGAAALPGCAVVSSAVHVAGQVVDETVDGAGSTSTPVK